MESVQPVGRPSKQQYQQNKQQKEGPSCEQQSEKIANGAYKNEFERGKDISGKDQTIERLQKSNKLITDEVQMIWQKLREIPQQDKKRKGLIAIQLTQQSLEKELKNANHLIQIIEKEIERYRKRQKSSNEAFTRMKRVQDYLIQREALALSLKQELLAKTKQTKQLERQIALKQANHTAADLRSMTEELNHLMELVKETEKREEQKIKSLKKQHEKVKTMEKELAEKGIDQAQIQEIKRKSIIEILPKSIDNTSTLQKLQNKNPPSNAEDSKPKQNQRRTQKRFDEMMHEIKVLQKKQEQFSVQYSLLDSEKIRISQQNQDIQEKIRACESEIESLEALSEKLRSKFIVRHRKKQRMKSLELQKAEDEKRALLKLKREKFKESYEKRSRRYRSLPSEAVTKEKKDLKLEKTSQHETQMQTMKVDSLQQGETVSFKEELGKGEQLNLTLL